MIEVRGLGKAYGQRWALSGVTLDIRQGDMFGLIGPNGAGKTTLIRILATILPPTAGVARILGRSVRDAGPEIRRRIGYMPDTFGVYEDLRVREYLEFFAACYGIRGRQREAAVQAVLELTDLWDKREELIGTLSRGMQQRLGLARVLVHDPEVLLLDEPASGLDPRARIEIRALLKELRRMGKTVLISSHILADIADLCNRIGLIEKGRLLFAGDVQEALEKVRERDLWEIELAEGGDGALAKVRELAFVESAELKDGRLEVSLSAGDGDAPELLRVLVAAGFRVRGFRRRDVTLEEAFLRLTRGEVS